MLDLGRFLKWTGNLPGRKEARRRAMLRVEELEERLVPTLLGQQLFPADYPWNQNIAAAPVTTNSAAIIAHIGGSIGIHPDWGNDSASNGNSPLYGIPYNVVPGNSTATVNVIIDNYPAESDIVPVPIPANAVLEGDYQNGPNPNGGGYNANQRGDSHLIVWDQDNNIAYELYGVTRPTDPTLFPNNDGVELPHTDDMWHAAQETVWNMSTDSFRTLGDTSADAAGLSILAGLARPDEGLPASQGGQGAIDHALRFTLPSGDVNPQYLYPASHMVSDSSGADKLPFGARLRLADTPDVNNAIDTMGPEAQIIAHAMQQYGLVLADIGSPMYVTGTSAAQDANNNISATWDMDDVLGLEALKASDFQVVSLVPVVTGLSATSGAAGNTSTVYGQNFAGAAGNLSVFFGSTPASSVTYVSDTQLTAVAPGGAGVVNVTVQSGSDETDNNSDNPNANVTAPIFGYGTSAITLADRFTFGSQTISAANSKDTFASATLVAGATDVLTIVVKDTAGNLVAGIASSAFAFNLAGGASNGTFGSAAATATEGAYTTTFTGAASGTLSTLTVSIGGVTLTTHPTIKVSTGAVNGATSNVSFAASSVASGGADLATIVVRDAAGNPVLGIPGTAFHLSLAGGASAGAFAIVTATAAAGTYTARFTATIAGTASSLTTVVNGVTLNIKPTVQVSAGGINGAHSTVSFATSAAASGNTDTLTIVVKDGHGNAIAGLAGSAFVSRLAGGISSGTFGPVTAAASAGTYTAAFTASTAGTASTLTVIVSGITLTSHPTIKVNAGTVNGANSTVHCAASTVVTGATDRVTIVVKDQAGNAVTGLISSAFHFSLAGGASTGTFGAVAATLTPGTYTVLCTGVLAGTASSLTVAVNGVPLTTTPPIAVTPGVVNSIQSTDSFATPTIALTQTDTLTILVADKAGNAITGLASSAFHLSLSGGTSAGTFGLVTETATEGTYAVAFTGTIAGTASTLTTIVNGVTLTSKPTITVTT